MKSIRFSAVILAAAVAFAAQSPARASSQITSAFLANLQTNVAFLDKSSRVAADHAQNGDIRAFASGEITEQSQLASGLNNLMPLIASTDAVVTGRSVAIDGQTGPDAVAPETSSQAANGRAPMVQQDVSKLAGMSGHAFDNLYWQQQLDALSQIEADYRAYIANGDDPVLVAMAKTELPKIVRRLELLSKI